MSGILTPMAAYELVSEIKKRFEVRLHLHCHATTGMAEMTLLKAIEAGEEQHSPSDGYQSYQSGRGAFCIR
ncbi:Oxaloacetate decarboxylase alpha chain [Salmonella enterica subsp. enterica serovar Typhimurium str. DT104]|nr:Oxaloacetate decarboxylase alpha chain [Salmonella enterica subsp. enterica serovar Typhimurium str. DT104]